MTILTSFNSTSTAADVMETLNAALAKVAAIPPLASFSSATLSKAEGNSGTTAFVFPVSLDKVWDSDVIYEYVTAAGGTNPADASDFTGGTFPRGIITIPAGSTQTNVSIPVSGDTTIEPNENFVVRLFRVAASSTGTILNDDSSPSLNPLTVSNSSAKAGVPFSSVINGLTSGSSIALTGAGAAGLAISGAVISGTPQAGGPVSIVETLAGASNSPRTTSALISVSVPGAVAPTLPYAPTIRFHPNTATMTMRADNSFQGYTSGGYLYVTTWDATQCDGIRNDIHDPWYVVHASLPAGTMITGMNSTNIGQGKTGSYRINSQATVGSSASPVTFTSPARRIVAINDTTGNSDGLQSPDLSGPIPITDGYGRKALMFAGNYDSLCAWLRNATYTGIDSHNVAWFIVGQVLHIANENQYLPQTKPIVQMNYPGSPNNGIYTVQSPGAILANVGNSICSNEFKAISEVSDQSVRKRMLLGMQMQVMGAGCASADGYNGTSNVMAATLTINEQVAVKAYTLTNTARRQKGAVGFTVNATPGTGTSLPASTNHNASTLLIYDIVGYTRGELGTDQQIAARSAAISSALMAGYNIPVVTKSMTALGDSRMAQVGSYYQPSTGYSIASLLTLPGPSAIPADVRVQNWALNGKGVGTMQTASVLTTTVGAPYPIASPMAPDFQFGSGKDYFLFLSGNNDFGGSTGWPTTNAASSTNAYVDDLYSGNNGAGYTGTFDATVGNNSNSATIANKVGTVIDGSTVTSGAPWNTGQTFINSTGGLSQYQVSAVPATTPTTVRVDGYVPFVRNMFARGFKGVWIAEPEKRSGNPGLQSYFAQKVKANAIADTGAATGGTYAGALQIVYPTDIKIGGAAPFGEQQSDYSDYFIDFIHYTEAGKSAIVEGGDDQTKGLRFKVKTLLTL